MWTQQKLKEKGLWHVTPLSVCMHTSARVLTQVSYLTSMSLGCYIYQMRIVSKRDITELMEGLNYLVHVKYLTENMTQKMITLNRNYHNYHSK